MALTNAPRGLRISDFKAITEKFGGLAKSCRFVVRILPGKTDLNFLSNRAIDLDDLTYMCEATQFPSRGFNNVDVRYYGPNQKLPFQTAYEDVNMTFLCRSEGFPERRFFDDWVELVNPSSSYDFNYMDNYTSEITVYQYADYSSEDADADAPDALYEFTLYDAWPVLVNAQDVSWADDTIQRLTISFSYSRWRRKDIDLNSQDGQYKLVDFPNRNTVINGHTNIKNRY